MTSFFEDSGKNYIESAVEEILSRCKSSAEELNVLKELISTAHLLIHRRNIQNKLLSNSKVISYDLFCEENSKALEIMKLIAESVRVSKLSSIKLSDFFSVEVSLKLKSLNGSDVFISISFLRHLDVIRTDGKWNKVDYAIYCGEDWDSMVTLLKMSFAHKGLEEPSGYYGFESSVDTETEEPEVTEPDNDVSNNYDFSDNYSVNDDNEMSEESKSAGEPEGEAEKQSPEEELIEFSLNNEVLKQLGLLLNPAMPPEVLLMYIVSLEFISFVILYVYESFMKLGNYMEH